MSEPPVGFGSYPPDDVTWLLTDLGDTALEVGTQDREELVQAGRPYYEMLPVEYEPDEAYLQLFEQALDTRSGDVARATALVSDLVLHERGGEAPVLVSLARAGVPVGILMRRWYAHAHGLDAPHHAVSIVRGGGIDAVALDWLLDRYPADRLQLVDGWTGKGAIVGELTEAVRAYRATRPDAAELDPTLAVLADPGSCTPLHGTREDFLIPSACLNSTVSGLVSRTVLRADLIGPGRFHGAKTYPHLATVDRSNEFVDRVTSLYDDITADPAYPGELAALVAADRTATWTGLAAVRRVAQEHGIDDVNLVKPGVGETTRVLLRRVPWKVLVRRGTPDDRLAHVVRLAQDRGVPVEVVDDLPYACIGLIRPVRA